MDPAPENLPPAGGDKAFLIEGTLWDKLRRLLERPQVALDPTQFSFTEDSTGIRTYRYTGPLGAGGGGGCFGFRLTDTGSTIKVAAGNAGNKIVGEHTFAYGTAIYLRVTLTASTGNYTAGLSTSALSTDTVTSVLLGSSTVEGVITQNFCGMLNVITCRNWYEDDGDKFGMTVTT